MDSAYVREKLSPAEKRKMFKQRYGDLLKPYGFFFKSPNYFRVSMSEQVVWMVSIYYGQSGHMCSLRVDAMPFELGLSEFSFREGDIHIDGDQLLNQESSQPPSFEEKFEAVYQEFVHKYLKRLLDVNNMQSWDELQLWLAGGAFVPFDVRRPWPNIVLKRYDQAAFHVRHRIQWLEDRLSQEFELLAQYEAKFAAFEAEDHTGKHPSTVAAWRRSLSSYVQMYRNEVERTKSMIVERKEFLNMLEPPHVDYLDAQVREATAQSLEACKAFFGKHIH